MRSIMQITALAAAVIGPYLFVKPGAGITERAARGARAVRAVPVVAREAARRGSPAA